MRVVRSSDLFDGAWYLRNYPDVAGQGADPLAHYMRDGWREGRDPGPAFATSSYLRANPDVARLGINPLVHFLEFGRWEGRDSFGHRPHAESAPVVATDFAAPFAVASFELERETQIAWTAAQQLERAHGDLLSIHGLPAGYLPPGPLRAAVEATAGLLGAGGIAEWRDTPLAAGDNPPLLDAWYVNSTTLRTRWAMGERPTIVRIFQYDAVAATPVAIVGEGCVQAHTDVIDARLRQPLFPLLFLFADAHEGVLGTRLMAFPSLCRGGLHYVETLRYAERAGAVHADPWAAGDAFAKRLRVSDKANFLIGGIATDAGAAGAHSPFFQRAVRDWLHQIVNIELLPPSLDGLGEDRAGGDGSRPMPGRSSGAVLHLAAGMVPTIAALCERAPQTDERRERVAPLFLCSDDPSQPSLLIELPDDWPASLESEAPRLAGGTGGAIAVPPAAIAARRPKPLSDAELLMPVCSTAAPPPRLPITWVMTVDGATAAAIEDCVTSLVLQEGAAADRLTIVHQGGTPPLPAANWPFDVPVQFAASVERAIRAADSPLIGFIAPEIILHDRGTAATLATLAADARAASASCALISSGANGRSWHAQLIDGAGLAAAVHPSLAPNVDRAVQHMWRSDFPVAGPCADLWLAKTALVAAWLDTPAAELEGGAFHVCSTRTTASRSAASPRDVPDFVPRAPADRTTRVGVLFG